MKKEKALVFILKDLHESFFYKNLERYTHNAKLLELKASKRYETMFVMMRKLNIISLFRLIKIKILGTIIDTLRP